MGTSFTGYNGYGFWARDEYVALWMANLVEKIDEQNILLVDPYKRFRDDLILQASICCTGAVGDCLIHLENSDPLRVWAPEMGQRALKTYQRFEGKIDPMWANAVLAAPGAVARSMTLSVGQPGPEHIDYGEKWTRLLKGDFQAAPIHPSGKFQMPGKGPVWDIELDVTKANAQNLL